MLTKRKWTKESTPVFFGYPEDSSLVAFHKREILEESCYTWKSFKSKKGMEVDVVEELLAAKLNQLTKSRAEKTKKRADCGLLGKLPWGEEVNRKRKLVASFLLQQKESNLADACRFTGCSYQMVKKVDQDLKFMGNVEEFRYPNQKSPEQLAELKESIQKVNGTYTTIATLKQEHKGFSRRFISRELRGVGLRWLKMQKNRKVLRKNRYADKEVLSVVTHLAQCLMNEAVEVYYLDEVHFPLAQTSDHHWTLVNEEREELFYNRRETSGDKLSVIAMCNKERFVAVQVFTHEICGDDFLFFLQEALTHVPSKAKISILIDNATWHKSESVLKSQAFKALYFNAPGLFESNLIENSFSFVRSDFRKRPLVHSLEEEAGLLLGIFFDDRNRRRFEGIERNHIRTLQSLLYRHYSAIVSRKHRTRRNSKLETEN
jgi:hypothetical protein